MTVELHKQHLTFAKTLSSMGYYNDTSPIDTDLYSQLDAQTQGTNAAFSVNCNTSVSSKQYPSALIHPLLLSPLMLLSICLNITIIAVIGCTKRLHTVPSVFIVSLAVSDVITAGIVTFRHCLRVSNLLTGWPCDLEVVANCTASFLIPFSVVSNIGNHLMISMERWLYIALPFIHQRIVTRRTTSFCLLSVWVISTVINVNLFFQRCGLQLFSIRVQIGIVCPVFHFALSFFMFIVYSHVAYISYHHTHSINKSRVACVPTGTQVSLKLQTLVTTKWRRVRMLVVVFGTYFLLVTPGVCTDVYGYVNDKNVYGYLVVTIVDFFWNSHCFLNFCIYAARDKVFRCALKQCLLKACFWWPKQVYPLGSTNLHRKNTEAD